MRGKSAAVTLLIALFSVPWTHFFRRDYATAKALLAESRLPGGRKRRSPIRNCGGFASDRWIQLARFGAILREPKARSRQSTSVRITRSATAAAPPVFR
jgi:hypothetical protein